MSKSRNTDRLVSFSAMFISLLTLFVFIYQTNLIHKQQHMSVYPHLMIGNGGTGSLNYEFTLSNEGVGPAIIEDIEVIYQEKDTFPDLKAFLVSQITMEDSIWISHTDIYEGELIPAGKRLQLFTLMDPTLRKQLKLPPNTIKGANTLRKVLNDKDLVYKIHYKSIYDDQWYVQHRMGSPIEK